VPYLLPLICLLYFTHCAPAEPKKTTESVLRAGINDTLPRPVPEPEPVEFVPFGRESAVARRLAKVAAGEPLVVHVFVPLCDNEHQGIVPVSARLGNGLSLRDNLYWGAKYGVANHFRELSPWRQRLRRDSVTDDILQRLVCERTYANGARVILVADAYRGDRMQACVHDFLLACAGADGGKIRVEDVDIPLGGAADLLVFNGHNGLMDVSEAYHFGEGETIREAAVIACASAAYFREHLN